MQHSENNIVRLQSLEENKCLLRARERTLSAAKMTQGTIVTLSIALPIAALWFGPSFPEIRPYLALSALILLLLEVGLIDGFQKNLLKRGAKLQEQYDTVIFGLPSNKFVAGTPVDHEDIRSLSAKPMSTAREEELGAWYEVCVARLPLHLARLVCQRTNISYNARLRRKYGNRLLLLTIVFGVSLLFIGLAMRLQFPELVMTLAVPFMPVLAWVLKERLQQNNAATSLTNLCGAWEKIWTAALSGADAVAVTSDSRTLQDAIYQHRERSPLIFDWVYLLFRNANEDEARHAAEHLVAQAEKVLKKGNLL